MNIKSTVPEVPFFNLNRQYAVLKPELDAALTRVFSDTQSENTCFVQTFERQFAAFSHSRFSVGVSSGTDAFLLALKAVGVSRGSEIILPANASPQTAWGIAYLGALPVFTDCSAHTWNIDPDIVEQKISKKTRAIIGIHTYGLPFEIERLQTISEKHRVSLIEDCSQAHGATYKRKRVGGFGDIACFSFFPEKNLGSYGEAGGITTDHRKYANQIRELISWEKGKQSLRDQTGFNLKMDQLQAAILSVKIKRLHTWNKKREYIGKRYSEGIKQNFIDHQQIPKGHGHVFGCYVISLNNPENLKKFLADRNIETKILYPENIYDRQYMKNLGYKKGECPIAEKHAETSIALPIFPEITDKEIDVVIDAVNDYKCEQTGVSP